MSRKCFFPSGAVFLSRCQFSFFQVETVQTFQLCTGDAALQAHIPFFNPCTVFRR